MSDRLEDDLMEDLLDEPEGRSHGMDEFDEADEFDELDDPLDDPGEPFDEEGDPADLEDAVAEALGADDADEFLGSIGNFLKKAAKGVGSVARVVAPIASAIPLPQTQMIGRAAGLIGKVLADEGDEMDAFDEMSDFADEDEAVHTVAPVLAGLALRSGLKHHVARIPTPQRKALVRTVTAATKHLARAHGPRAVVALPGIVHHARRVVARQGLPASRLPHVIKRTARAAVRSPQVLRKMAQTGAQLRTHARRAGGMGGVAAARGLHRVGHHRGVRVGGGGACPVCGRTRTWRLRGPVRLTIESL